MVTILLIGVLLGICLTLVLGAKVRSTPPVGTYEATVQHDGSDVWVLNTSTGDLYRCQISNRSWEIFGCVPE
jgi:hypothetical protein